MSRQEPVFGLKSADIVKGVAIGMRPVAIAGAGCCLVTGRCSQAGYCDSLLISTSRLLGLRLVYSSRTPR